MVNAAALTVHSIGIKQTDGSGPSDVGLLGQLEAGDESGEREAEEGEEGHADGRRRRVGKHVVRPLAHAVGDWDRGGQCRHQEVGGHL
jgi:hypothetical protein